MQSQLALKTAALFRLTTACGCKLGSSATCEVSDGDSKPVDSSEKNIMTGENIRRACDDLSYENQRGGKAAARRCNRQLAFP